MVKARKPVEKTHALAKSCLALIGIVHAAAVILIVVSGSIIIWNYYSIISGNLPTEIEKIQLDYSISIFAGAAIYLLVYAYKTEEIIKTLFHVKEVPPIK